MPVEKKCVVCGRTFKVPPCRALTAKACSHKCAVSVRAKSTERQLTIECENCGKQFSIPQSHKNRRRFCSTECKFSSKKYLGEMGTRVNGSDNPMWKGGISSHSGGYLYERKPDHPFSSNGYVFKHRLIMEDMLREKSPSHRFLVKLGNNMYLRSDVVVHHLDGNTTNNKEENLIVCTKSAHSTLHNGKEISKEEYWPQTAKIILGRKTGVKNV